MAENSIKKYHQIKQGNVILEFPVATDEDSRIAIELNKQRYLNTLADIIAKLLREESVD